MCVAVGAGSSRRVVIEAVSPTCLTLAAAALKMLELDVMREGWGGWRGGEAEGSESLLKLMQVNFRNGENFEVCKNICLINEIHEYVPEFCQGVGQHFDVETL